MAIYFIFFIIIFSGFFARLEKDKRFNLLKATVMVTVESLISSIFFFAIISLVTNTFLKNILLFGVGSLFSLVLLIAIINGIVLYWLNMWLIPKFNITNQVQTLCEYIIQWSLIYITVYQVIFDNFIGTLKSSVENIDITNPSELVIIILPSLISVWIAVILYKTKKDSI